MPAAGALDACDALLLGREVSTPDVTRARAALDRLAASDGSADADWTGLAGRLRAYADVEALVERNLLLLDDRAAAVSAEAAFHDACRHHRRGADGGQAELRPLLLAALAHSGVTALDDGDDLREALWRLAAPRARPLERERLVTSLVRAVAALVRRGAAPVDARLLDDLAAVARVATGSSPAVADAAELVRSELVDTGPSTPMDVTSIDLASVAGLRRYAGFDLEPVSGVHVPGGRAVVARATSRRDPADARTVLAVEVDRAPADLSTASDADLAPFATAFSAGVRLLRHERDRRLHDGRRRRGDDRDHGRFPALWTTTVYSEWSSGFS